MNDSRPIALITGASSGMGYAYARLLAQKGYDLVIVSNEEDALKDAATKFTDEFKVNVLVLFKDLARQEAAQEVYDHCKEKDQVIDVLINNAGFYFFDETAEADRDKARKMLLLHVVTTSLMCTLFGKDMKERRRGHILNMSSISAWMPYPGLSYYASTKRYILNFSRSLRSEMIDYNVNVTCVCPGATATNLFDRNKVDYEKALRTGIMMTADRVAAIGLRALFRKKARVIPGLFNKFIVPLVRITPSWMVLFLKRHTKLIDA